ncbi:MAG: FG-GAP repeat domain-containing protein [Thermoanaerobaculia bacterium]
MWTRTFLVLAGLSSASVAAGGFAASWVEIASGLPERGEWRNGFDLADFNGDGRLDLVHGPPRRTMSRPRVFVSGPDGKLARWRQASFPALPFDYGDAAAADFDGDAHFDIALGVHFRGLVVLSGDGRGGFQEQASYLAAEPGGSAFSSRALATGDLDSDGRSDIVALGEGPRPPSASSAGAYGIRVLLNRLPESWDWLELQPSTGRLFGNDVTLGDFDGDGHLDIASASSVQGQRGVLFWGDGQGGFSAGELAAARPRSLIEALAAADFDADGDDDLAIVFSDLQGAREKNGLDLMISVGARRWLRQELLSGEDSGRPTAAGAGDLDGDGDPDLVALTASGALALFENVGGRLGPVARLPPAQGGRGCHGYHVRLADLDGDGVNEIVAGFADEDCESGGSLRVWKRAAPSPDLRQR